jgi:hypothetical protein
MQWLPTPIGKIVPRIGLTFGGASAGWLAVVHVIRGTSTGVAIAIVAAATVLANALPKALEAVYKHRPRCIAAKGEADAKRIRAKSDATVAVITAKSDADTRKGREDTRNKLLLAAKENEPLEAIKLQAMNPDLPASRRMTDENILKLANSTTKPRGTGKGPAHTPTGVVRPLRQPPGQ